MSLEQKIKQILEDHAAEKTVTVDELLEETIEEVKDEEVISEGEAAADNAKITAGKSKKFAGSNNSTDPLTMKQETGDKQDDNGDNAKIKAGLSRKLAAEDVDASEHLDALAEGEDLSEDFKAKAKTIFEAAVADMVNKEMERLEEEHQAELSEAVEEVRAELIENIDGYLTAVVNEWMTDNAVALERGIKVDIVENFIDGLKGLFNEHYIEVPEEKYDVLDEQAEKIEELISTIEESASTIEALSTKVEELTKIRIMESVGDSLTDTEYEKFADLCEGADFDSEEGFTKKVQTIKESYFPKGKGKTVVSEQDSPVMVTESTGVMSKYVDALKNPLNFAR
jgi:hypothetical protein